jgi:phage regulator Rha-like protein
MTSAQSEAIIPIENIARKIHVIRDCKVMLDSDLAELYGVETRVLNQSVRRNKNRFPEDFMFQLNDKELENLRSQSVTSSWGGRRYPPYAFTEQGVAMLSSVINSKVAVQVNISIIRTFVRMREMLATHKDVARKIEEHDRQIANLYVHIERLLKVPEVKKNPIGYIWDKEN